MEKSVLDSRSNQNAQGEHAGEEEPVGSERNFVHTVAESELTQISALVVMAFPAYKLIISGAR